MLKNPQKDNDEINLNELMQIVWEGKWKIAVAVIISLIAVISYQSTQTKNFTAITEVKPISALKLNKLYMFNNLIESMNTDTNTDTNTNTNTDTNENDNISEQSTKMSSLDLLNLYIDVLNDGTVFENAIRKFNLLEASQYNNEQKYSEAITNFAASIKILSNRGGKKKNLSNYPIISIEYHDVEKWKSVLSYVDRFANKLVNKFLIEEYNNTLLFLKIERKHQLEDISIKINNYIIDYEREISDRMVYLKEQSAIALKLGIAKNTIEVQTFGSQNTLLSNVKTDSPFYLRGYEAINKEIELIELRDDKKAFIGGLFDLEKKKRAIEQDQTIERVKLALQSNLPNDNNEFFAASINPVTTIFEYKDNTKIYVLAIVIGLMAGISYVLISNAFQSFRVSKKN